MEEMKNGVISEEALDEVAGGLKIDKAKFTKALKVAGVAVAGIGAVAGLGAAGYFGKQAYDKKQNASAAAPAPKEQLETDEYELDRREMNRL